MSLVLQSAWFVVPCLVWYSIVRKIKSGAIVIISGAILLLYNLYIVVSLYFVPIADYQNAAHVAAFSPLIGVLVVIPTALFSGWLINALASLIPVTPSAESRKKILKTSLILGAATLLLIHKSLIRLVNVEARIGEPRVVLGGETFKKTGFTNSGEISVGDFDGDSLEEMAADYQMPDYHKKIRLLDVLHPSIRMPESCEIRKIRLLDTHDFSVKKEWLISETLSGKIGSLPFLAKLKRDKGIEVYFLDRMNRYDDSYSLYDLKGNAIWRRTFRCGQFFSAAGSIQGADLDNDGEMEFYGESNGGLCRVDARGRVQWTVEQFIEKAYLLPAKNGNPAMIFVKAFGDTDGPTDHMLQFYRMQLWSIKGKLVREFKFDKDASWLSLITWKDSYCFATAKNPYGGRGFYIFDLTGATVFEGTVIKDMKYEQALSVRFAPDEKPYLVVRATGGGSVNRQGIDIYSSDGKLVYREIFKQTGDSFITAIESPAGIARRVLRTGDSFIAVTDHVTGRGYFIWGDTKYEKAVSPQNNLPAAVPHKMD